MRIKGIKILRVYGNVIEQEEFPIPNQVKPTRPTDSQEELRVPENLKGIALHKVIRDTNSPYALEPVKLKNYEDLFATMKENKEIVEKETVKAYLKVLHLERERKRERKTFYAVIDWFSMQYALL